MGACLLDLDGAALQGPVIGTRRSQTQLKMKLVAAAERRAVQFGMLGLSAPGDSASAAFWSACGYRPEAGAKPVWRRSFPRRQTRYGAQVARLLNELGIPAEYGRRHRLPLQVESHELASIGADVYDRERHLRPGAARAWLAMQRSAAADGVELLVASAFRSVDYQAGIVRRKLESGQAIAEILAVSAAPGFSEHHTGRAVDVATRDCEPLEECFEDTEAYAWLDTNAARHAFRLSYPRGNRHGIIFEPWHWYWTGR
jgi:D-alanyl-D-alanine carboxypeptidase